MAVERKFKIRASPTVRKQIIKIIKENHLSIDLICKDIGYSYPECIMWLNAKDGGRPSDAMDEVHIVKLCEVLGIGIEITFTVHPVPKESLEKYNNKKISDATDRLNQRKKKKIEEFFKEED